VAEAAAALEVPEGTVKSRCSRGRARLAVMLAGVRNPDAGSDVPSTPDDRSRPDRPEVT
jgi:RNA polymerase sigma-70 factor (ECF subfamily)